nr:kinetochore-associated protein NSL1 homolog [Anser cygnoides]
MAAGAAARRDPRVRCCSRRGLGRGLGLCAPFLRALAAGQPGGIAADDVLWNFEAAVRENVTINGQPWGDTSASSEPCDGCGDNNIHGADEVELRLGFVCIRSCCPRCF